VVLKFETSFENTANKSKIVLVLKEKINKMKNTKLVPNFMSANETKNVIHRNIEYRRNLDTNVFLFLFEMFYRLQNIMFRNE
jgi:hypothetical protein